MEKRHKCGSGCPALGIPRSRTSTSTLAAGLGSGRRNGRTGAPFRSPKAAARLRHPTPLGTHRRAAAAAAAAGTRRPAAARSRSPWCGASRTATAPCAQRSAPRSVPAAAHRPRPRRPASPCAAAGGGSERHIASHRIAAAGILVGRCGSAKGSHTAAALCARADPACVCPAVRWGCRFLTGCRSVA